MKIRAVALAITVGVAGLLPGAVAAADGTEGSDTFEARATAEAFRFNFGAPSFLFVDRFVDFGSPVAEASVDSLGRSKAWASDPFPGDLPVVMPGTLAGLTRLPNPGNYPFFVASSYPATPERKVEAPGLVLTAKSEENRSSAAARHGGVADDSAVLFSEATGVVEYTPATGAVQAESKAVARHIDIGGVLRIGIMESSAKVHQTPGQPAVSESSFRADLVSVAGQAVGVSSKGLTIAGTNNPLPDGSPMAEALKSAHITVEYVQAVNSPGEVTSPGLVVTQRFQVPQGPEMISTLVLGRSVAKVSIGDVVVAADESGGAPGDAAPAPQATMPWSRSRRMASTV
jgi:hypothetical protein